MFLDDVKDGLARATPGPWECDYELGELSVRAGSARTVWTETPDGVRLGKRPGVYMTTDLIYEHMLDEYDDDQECADDDQRRADAEFIASAPTVVARLSAAVEAVLALHKRIEVPYSASMLTKRDGTVTTRSTTKPTCDYCARTHVGGGEFVSWPCPTVRAVASHLDPKENPNG